MTNWDNIVSGEELDKAAAERKKTEERISKVKLKDVPAYEAKGWKKIKEAKNGKTFSMCKPKQPEELFENYVWTVFYKMGFTQMNKDNTFKVDFDGNSKQIDIFAMDDETCIFIECKSSTTFDKSRTFKTEIEAINGYYGDLLCEVKKQFGNNYKFKYIFATQNYLIADSSADMERLIKYGIKYFDYDTIQYFDSLTTHLGKAARYQLLGALFRTTDIKSLDNKVCALKGTMGGVDYFMFCIEPERLLKMSYVLHRTKANHLMMPTYQRLIKKERLGKIREFINNGGYFPNSIIVSIDAKDNKLQFDLFPSSGINSPVKGGVLHLPKHYHSLYIIDGQHRLYGYSETKYAKNNYIPVVAFVGMDSGDQVKMFMDINENQKSVPKSLRNTLSIDLQWNSKDPKKRKEALMLQLAETLGEDSKSPLYKRVLVGEEKATNRCCITTEYLKDAIKDSYFLNEYSKNEVKRIGTFDKNNNDKTLAALKDFIIKCFKTIADYCGNDWESGADGFLSINNTCYALIRIFDDIVNLKLKESGESIVTDNDSMYQKCEEYLLDLSDTINALSAEQKNRIKTAKGGSAKKESWRILQVALNKKNITFINDELQKYIDSHCTDNHDEAESLLKQIEEILRNRFKEVISTEDKWRQAVPSQLGESIASKVGSENYKRKATGVELVDSWYFVSFNEMLKISVNGSNWSTFGQNILKRESMAKATKSETSIWMTSLSNYKTKLSAGKSITKDDFKELETILKDIKGETDAINN